MSRVTFGVCLAALVLLFSMPALAHHSFGAEFDAYRAKTPLWIPRPPKDPPVEDPADFYPFGKIVKRERGALLNVAAMIGLAVAKPWLLG